MDVSGVVFDADVALNCVIELIIGDCVEWNMLDGLVVLLLCIRLGLSFVYETLILWIGSYSWIVLLHRLAMLDSLRDNYHLSMTCSVC